MAKVNELQKDMSKNQLVPGDRLQNLVGQISVKRRFEELLGKKAPGFISSMLSVANSNTQLQQVDPHSILAAGAVAAALDLPINANLGFAYIVPYKCKAQFQMGYKGFIQLGIRSGQYETMNASEVYEDEIKFWNPITGEIEFHPIDTWKFRYEDKREKIVGYMAFLKMLNGFRKYLYMTRTQLEAHGKRFSQSYHSEFGQWKKDPHSMMLKTVIKLLLSKYGLLSIEMQKAVQFDQGVVHESPDGGMEVSYPDGPNGEVIDMPADPPGSMSEQDLKHLESEAKNGNGK